MAGWPSRRAGKTGTSSTKVRKTKTELRYTRRGSNAGNNARGVTTMKTFVFATIIASGLVAGALGIAAPAAQAAVEPVSSTTISAGVDHHVWLDQIGPQVNVPKVDNSVHQSR